MGRQIADQRGAGTLILSGDNDYSGGTAINEGTLVTSPILTALGTGLVDNNAALVLDVDGRSQRGELASPLIAARRPNWRSGTSFGSRRQRVNSSKMAVR